MAIRTGCIKNLVELNESAQGDFLTALARSAEILSDGKGWPSSVTRAFDEIGRAIKVNRIWLFQVLELSDKHMVMNYPFEWVDDQKYALKATPLYDTIRWDFETCSSVYRTLVASRRRREWQSVMIDELEECDFKEYQQAQGIKSTLTIPVIVQGQWWGLFGFDDCMLPRQWSEQEKSLLRMVAHLISDGVLRDRMNSTRRQFEILSSITESSAWELDTGSGYFWCNNKIFSEQVSVSENIHMTPLQVLRRVHPDDRGKMLDYLRQQIRSRDVNFRIDLRLSRGERYIWSDVIAKISLDSNNGLKKLSGITVDIPGRKEKEEKLLRKATLDALTGIANRGTFDAQLNNMQRSMEKSESSFSLLFLDVDDFKKVNDIWGHSVGDMALKHIAKILQSTLKNHDFVARIGGEEFAMLLHNISPDKSLRFAERICGLIESSPLIVPTGNIPLTVSIGLVHSASLSDEVTNEGMYQLADEALYQAKNSGRNMVVVYQ